MHILPKANVCETVFIYDLMKHTFAFKAETAQEHMLWI
jgi:hypothetical protein